MSPFLSLTVGGIIGAVSAVFAMRWAFRRWVKRNVKAVLSRIKVEPLEDVKMDEVIRADSVEEALAEFSLRATKTEHPDESLPCAGCAMRQLAGAIVLISRKQSDFTPDELVTNISAMLKGEAGATVTKH